MNKRAVKKTPKGTALVKKGTGLPKKAAEGVRAIAAVDPQALLSQAIAQGLPEVSMKELFAMRREMEAERSKKEYFKALAGFQRECPIVYKTKKVKGKPKEGKPAETKYTYAPIEDLLAFRETPKSPSVKELLNKWEFSYTFKSKQEQGKYTAICVAHHADGHEEATEFTVPTDFPDYMNMSGAQEQGASCTYADRYAFKNAFGIVTRGDDTDAARTEDDQRRKPIQEPREKSPDTVEAHAEVKALSDYGKIISLLQSTSTDPKTKQIVKLFNDNEVLDYTHEANENKDKPDELKKILGDIVQTGAKRHKAVKGEV